MQFGLRVAILKVSVLVCARPGSNNYFTYLNLSDTCKIPARLVIIK